MSIFWEVRTFFNTCGKLSMMLRQLGERLLALFHDGQQLQAGKDAVAGGDMVKKDQMAGLFAAEGIAFFAHAFNHVAIADGGADHFAAHFFHGDFQAHIGHHRGHQGLFLEFSLLHQFLGADGHDMIAVDQLPMFIANDQPVTVAVQGQADIGAQLLDLGGHLLRMQGAACIIDILAVGGSG